jgi:ABC-type transport system involved in cytochrome bd biosynthesis fused ATPase/permease subunit
LVRRHKANGSDTSGMEANACFEGIAMLTQSLQSSFLPHSHDCCLRCWFSIAVFFSFSFNAAIVFILLLIGLRHILATNLLNSVMP